MNWVQDPRFTFRADRKRPDNWPNSVAAIEKENKCDHCRRLVFLLAQRTHRERCYIARFGLSSSGLPFCPPGDAITSGACQPGTPSRIIPHMPPFLPMTRQEMDRLGWDELDILLVSGDA